MKRLRVLGLTAVLAFAMSVTMSASTAFAGVFTTDHGGSVTLKGEAAEVQTQFTIGTLPLGCTGGDLDGTFEGPSLSMAVDLQDDFNCTSGYVETNDCALTFHPGLEEGAGTFAVGGPECGGIEVHRTGGFACSYTIVPQAGLAASYEEGGSSPTELLVELNATAKVTDVEGGSFCPEEEETANWNAEYSVDAFQVQGGAPDGLHLLPYGLYLENDEFQSAGGEWAYPLSVAGEQSEPNGLILGLGTKPVRCEDADFGAALFAASTSLGLHGEFNGCEKNWIYPATIDMHSCEFIADTSGTFDITCTKEGDSIEVLTYSIGNKLKCTSTIPPQEGLEGVGFTNLNGPAGLVRADFEAKGIEYTTAGELTYCGQSNGTHTDGTFAGGLDLFGAN